MKWLTLIVCFSTAGMIVLREQILKLLFEWDRASLNWTIQPMINSHGIDRVTVPLLILGRYVRLLAWPSHLSIDYGVAVIGSHATWSDPYVIVGIVSLILWLALTALCLWRRWWAAMFCLLATAITYAMISNVFLIGAVFGERLMYLPSVFILIVLAMMIARLPGKILMPVIIAMVVLASFRTVTYAARWNDKDEFYRASLKDQPRSIRLHLLVTERAMRLGDYAYARKVMADSREIEPTYWENWQLAAVIEDKLDNEELALEYAKKGNQLGGMKIDIPFLTLQEIQRKLVACLLHLLPHLILKSLILMQWLNL